MMLGMSLATFTQFHVIISLMGIGSGILVLIGMLQANLMPKITAVFLATTVATSVTGFMFPFTSFGPPEIVGLISLIVLIVAILALYSFKLAGSWRWVYVATALFALYLNVFVAVVQSFLKLDFVRQFAPTQSEPPFAIAHAVVLVIFVVLGVLGGKCIRLHRAGTRQEHHHGEAQRGTSGNCLQRHARPRESERAGAVKRRYGHGAAVGRDDRACFVFCKAHREHRSFSPRTIVHEPSSHHDHARSLLQTKHSRDARRRYFANTVTDNNGRLHAPRFP
jgi:hypothetical protein